MKKVLATLIAGLAAFASSSRAEPVRAGALYSVDSGKGYFQVAKVLAIDSAGVHIRLYRNRFETRPIEVDFASLKLGNIHDQGPLGIGHLPLTHRDFAARKPLFIAESPVTDNELAGYREWESANGGYFGTQ